MDVNEKPQQMPSSTPSSESVNGTPVDVWDMVNKFGHYEVQDTTQTENQFPMIGPKKKYLIKRPSKPHSSEDCHD